MAELAVADHSWAPGDEGAALDTLRRLGVSRVDVSPSRAFGGIYRRFGPDTITDYDIGEYRDGLGEFDISVSGLISIVKDRTENFLMDNVESAHDLAAHLKGVIRMAGRMGVGTVVYKGGYTRAYKGSENTAFERALSFFGELGKEAWQHGVILGVTPVSTPWPDGYQVLGAHSAELFTLLSAIRSHDADTSVRFAPETAEMLGAEDDIPATIAGMAHAELLAPHFLIAEAGLAPISPRSPIDHHAIGNALRGVLPQLAGSETTIALDMIPALSAADFSDEKSMLQLAVRAARQAYAPALTRHV